MTINSNYIEQLYQINNDSNIRLVSFDMFDTLVFRACGSPDALFQLVAKDAFELGLWNNEDLQEFVTLRRHAEELARRHSFSQHGHREVNLADIYAQWPLVDADALMSLEQAIECANWRVNSEVLDALEVLLRNGKRLAIVSDMYLSHELISAFWQREASSITFDAICVSGDCGTSKQDGGLFNLLLERVSLLPSQVVHVGDHEVTDVQMAKAAGLNTLHTPLTEYYQCLQKYEHRLCQLQVPDLDRMRKLWLWKQSSNHKAYELGGLVFGPLLWGFATWLVAHCQSLGIKTIYCLLREGEVLANIIKQIPNHTLSVHTLAVSRRSSYLLSLASFKPSTLYQLATRRGYTLSEFIEDVGLTPPPLFSNILAMPLAQLIKGNDWRVLFDWVIDNLDAINTYLEHQKKLLQQFLCEKGVVNRVDIAIVDWGCGASLFSNLTRVVELQHVQFFMFYRSPKALDFSLRFKLIAYQPLEQATWSSSIAAYPELAEILLNGVLASTKSYKHANGGVVAEWVALPKLTVEHRTIIQEFYAGLTVFIKLAASEDWFDFEQTVAIRTRIFSCLYRLVQYPITSEASCLMHLQVPLAQGASSPLISEKEFIQIKQESTTARHAHAQYLDGGLQLISDSWWFPGAITLAYPSEMSLVGELSVAHDDDVVAPMLLKKLKQKGIVTTAIYGAGELGAKVYRHLLENGINVSYVIDRRAEEAIFTLGNHQVISLKDAILQGENVFSVASRAFAEEIKEQILTMYPQLKPTILLYHSGGH
ncbi:Predicted hydrolase (HAD superfamily) [Shewanella putrefaciens]|nr:Predicted hydrolase (HAD superfamily) [Shewanella putrefaciens]